MQGWAERVLFGATLADKLASDLADAPGPRVGRLPAPARPPELALPTGRRPAEVPRALRDDRDRARVLHELANHELQALELFALAALRWPDAPPGFLRSLRATARDEQRHLRAYLDRLAACGGAFGEWPVSRAFWDALEPVGSPDAFTAGMALCFETANLDFCGQWIERFQSAGDAQTARVLEAVREDEVRHVARGLVWFPHDPSVDRLDAWARALPAPLDPARARGPRFDAERRVRAGFTRAEVDRLRVMGGSRGRLPRALWFDAGLEDALADGRPSARADRVTADLALVPMFLCGAEDVVVAPEPSVAHRVALADAGFPVPRFVSSLEDLRGERLQSVEPWGPGPHVRAPALDARVPAPGWDPAWKALSSKVEVALRAAALAGLPGVVEQLGAVWRTEGDPGPGPWVLKAPFSTSGGARRLGQGPLTDADRSWLAKRLRAGPVVWQPWRARAFDLSAHVTVADDGVRLDGITRFAAGPRGAFQGVRIGPWWEGLEPHALRALHAAGLGPPALGALVERAARLAGDWAFELGFRGHLSIDAAVVHTPDGPRVHPWLETNARRTLGRVGLAMARVLGPTARGWWRVARADALGRAELAEALAQRPLTRSGGRPRGALATTEPHRARELLTWLDLEP